MQRFLLPSFVLVVLASLAGCGKSTPLTVLSDVAPLFANNGANWNDYVQGSDWSTATDTACDAASDTACVHGGETRVVYATGKADCTGLTAKDSLGAFNWTCDPNSGNPRFVSTGLADGKYLSDLIDFSAPAFKPIGVTIYRKGTPWGETASTVWWTNTLQVQNTPAFLTAAGTIYLVTADTSDLYSIGGDKIGLVAEPGVTLSGNASSSAVGGVGFHYAWFEGMVDGTYATSNISVYLPSFSVFRNVHSDNAGSGIGFYLSGGTYNRLTDITLNNNSYGLSLVSFSDSNVMRNITAKGNTFGGVSLGGSRGNQLTDLYVSDNGKGVSLDGGSNRNIVSNVQTANDAVGVYVGSTSTNNRISNVDASNSGSYGVYVSYATSNTFSDITVANSADSGIYTVSARNNRFANITVAGAGSNGIQFGTNSANNIILAVTSANNSDSGVSVFFAFSSTIAGLAAGDNLVGLAGKGANGFVIDNIASANNGTVISEDTTTNSIYRGLLEITSANCSLSATTSAGVDSSCNQAGGSDFGAPVTGVSVANSFVGKVSSDAANTSDSSGTANYPADPTTFDWLNFDNVYRAWGIDGSAFPNADNRGRWTTGTGRIWDWSASTGDTGNSGSPAILGVLSMPTGNDTLTHVWYGAPTTNDNAGCDAMVAGSIWNSTDSVCQTTFLRRAIEIQGDGIGNDNTLCESGETCLYTPNIGSYQGHGTLVSAGTFTDGTITGVTLMQYSNNGR